LGIGAAYTDPNPDRGHASSATNLQAHPVLALLRERTPLSAEPPQLTFEVLPTTQFPLAPRRLGALWRRLLAFAIDAIIVGVAGLTLGYIFFDLFMGLGPAGRLVGYFVGFFYFAIPESSFGNGQSVGKRLLSLQIVNADGMPLSIERSSIRYTLFAIPWFVYGLALPITRTPPLVDFLLGMGVFALGGAGLYLMLFNRNTRQGVHDVAAGSYVVEARGDGVVQVQPVGRVHWIMTAVIVILAAAAGIAGPKFATHAFPQMLEDQGQVEQLPGVQSASMQRVITDRGGAKDVSLTVKVRCVVATTDEQALANQVADSIITTDPGVDQYSMLRVVIVRGYDIGIAHGWFSQTYSDTPAGWKREFFGVPPQLPAH
jgi:uncharacterized RDD family membrane protein YckC